MKKHDPKKTCHWATCQNPQTKNLALCEEHVALSALLGLKVWPVSKCE